MKKTKIALCTLLIIATILFPFAFAICMGAFLPPAYSEQFTGAIDEKCERLYGLDEPKIVIVGGSSVAFGIDSALIEKYTGMPVVNFGLYAALGTKLMLDLSRTGIGEGDIVILAPELDSQTLSMYFNTESTLRAFDGNLSLIKHVRGDDRIALLSGMWNFSTEKLKKLSLGDVTSPTGVYNAKNFNEYGDVSYPRDENVMPYYYDTEYLINPTPEILDDEFAEYLNEYIEECKGRGAEVYFSFCPMNEMGLAPGATDESLSNFSDYVSKTLDCTVISDIGSYVYGAGYFYDTNFHLNDRGVRVHTVNLLQDLLLELGIPTYVDEEIPEPAPLKDLDVIAPENDENCKYFTFEQMANKAYKITGLTELGKAQKTLTVPKSYLGYKVMVIGAGAFADSSVTKLILTEDTNIRTLATDSFKGAGTLKELWIYYHEEQDILPPASFFGVSSGFVVHVPKESSYDMGYYWSERGLTFIKDIE